MEKSIIDSEPKYKQLKRILRNRIVEGNYKELEKIPSENQIAKEFSLSKHTVLKSIHELANEGFIYRIQGKGTFVQQARKRRKNKIAVIVYRSESPYFSKMIRGIEDSARQYGFHVILCNSVGDFEKETSYIRELYSDVDGFLIAPVYIGARASDGVKLLLEKNKPIVFLSHVPRSLKNVDLVVPDYFQGGYLLTKHLIENGYRRICFLTVSGGLEVIGVKCRYLGYRKALEENNLSFTADLLIETTDQDPMNGYISDGYSAAEKVVKEVGKGSCIFASFDTLAIGLLRGLTEKQVSVPEEIGVCGFDDIDISARWGLALTTAASPIYKVGEAACGILIDKIEGKRNVPQQLSLPVELKVRNTTRRWSKTPNCVEIF